MLRTDPMAPHLGCDRGRGPGLRPLPRRPGQARTWAPADSSPDSRKEGSEGAAGAPRGGRTLVRSDLQAPQASDGHNRQDSHPRRPPGSPGPRTPADLPLALAPTVSTAAQAPAPAAPLMGAPCRRLRNQRCSRPAPLLGGKPRPRGGNRRKWPWEG